MSTNTADVVHYGILRRSGRYPWGSGGDLLDTIENLSKQGLSEVEIAKGLGISTTDLRNQKALAKGEEREAQRIFILRQKESGMSNTAIAEEIGIPESTVRELLKPAANAKYRIIKKIAEVLKKAIEKYGYIDVGEGTEQYLGVTNTKMKNAIALLRNEGYTLHYLKETQLGTGKPTSIKVLAAPGVEWPEVYANRQKIQIPNTSSIDGGRTFDEPLPVKNVDSNRLRVVHDPRKDGLIELRTGTEDLSLSGKSYAQVRIGIDGTHYIKGMAVHDDSNMTPGIDMIFYTSKDISSDPRSVLKEQNLEDVNPFGATIKQSFYVDKEGNRQASAVNLVYGEGDWSSWNSSLSSQFLSKQDPRLAAQQLELVANRRTDELNEILSLTNETVKAHLLKQYADAVDREAVHLKAAALPRQTTNVLIPVPSMTPTEVYAPNYRNGDELILVRYPHGGIFELPRLTVNNKNVDAKNIIGSAQDAIAIHPDVARRLSGADFDGDTVIAIPNNRQIRTAPALEGLKNFDPITTYQVSDGLRVPSELIGIPRKDLTPKQLEQVKGKIIPLSPEGKQMQMGIVSNLITDMTIKGASPAEIARAVRHSMVVIDAEKHYLNYQQSYIDNGIAALKDKYQEGGASTIISRAKSINRVRQRKDNYAIDPETGEKIFTYTNETYVDKNSGKEVYRTTKSTRLYEESDAHALSSGTRIERVYADHSNTMKSLGNQARKALVNTQPKPYSPSAAKTYKDQVASLNRKLSLSLKNQPLERKAQLVANALYSAQLKNHPNMSAADKRTARGRALVLARSRVGARKPLVDITNKEWEAIQMGAISPTKLARILKNADADKVRALATPRTNRGLSAGKVTRATQLLDLGYTRAEVADVLGVSVSQINSIELDK